LIKSVGSQIFSIGHRANMSSAGLSCKFCYASRRARRGRAGIHSVTSRQDTSGAECGSIRPRISPKPLMLLTSRKNFTLPYPHRLHLPHTHAIALAGDLVRTGYQGRVSVPDWSHNGVRLGDDPPSPGLDRGFRRHCCPR
jgi:hypothetical protein